MALILTPLGSLQLVPVTRIDTKKTHEEQEMSQTLADDSEVMFDQPEESAGAMEPEGSSRNRHRKDELLKKLLEALTPAAPPPSDEDTRCNSVGKIYPTVDVRNGEKRTGPSDSR